MGLDMYLEEDTDLPYQAETRIIVNGEEWHGYNQIEKITQSIGYWRKANAIHGWFTKHCADGVDDCQRTYVSFEKILELYNLCTDLLKTRDRKAAMASLPPTEGFFFGSSVNEESDDGWDWYWTDLEDTVKILKPIAGRMLEGKVTKDQNLMRSQFFYQASW